MKATTHPLVTHSISEFSRWIGITASIVFCCMALNACDAFTISSFPIHHYMHRHHIYHHHCDGSPLRYSRKTTKTGTLFRVNTSTLTTPRTKTLLFASKELNQLYENFHVSVDAVSSIILSDEINSSYSTSTASVLLSSIPSPIENDIIVPIIVIVALTIGILANGWISSLISGEQGLGSYLSDGSGYNKSKFKPIQRKSNDDSASTKTDRAVQGDDPLPWLRLPNLDFVEVAGQKRQPKLNRNTATTVTSFSTSITDTTSKSNLVIENNSENETTTDMIALEELELLRLRMQEQLLLGNLVQAEQLRNTLERLMKENNIQFTKEVDPFQ